MFAKFPNAVELRRKTFSPTARKIEPNKAAKTAKKDSSNAKQSNAKRPERSEAPQENSSNSFKRETIKREAFKTFFNFPIAF
jgi:hypothetical protein